MKLKKQEERKIKKLKQIEKLKKKAVRKLFLKNFLPLLIAVLLWVITLAVLHLPSIKEGAQQFFVGFTLNSSVLFGSMVFLPVSSPGYPNITVDGYTMKIVMGCTACNFYIFVVFLGLLSPVHWKQRLLSLAIFITIIFIINNLRFITMGYIGKYNPSWFEYIHDYLWNILFGLLIFAIWYWRYRKTIEKANLQNININV